MRGGDRAAVFERVASAVEAVLEEFEDVDLGCAEWAAACDRERDIASADSSQLEEQARRDVSRRLVEAVVASEMGVAVDELLQDASEVERAESGLRREEDAVGKPGFEESEEEEGASRGAGVVDSGPAARPRGAGRRPALHRRGVRADLGDVDDEEGPSLTTAAEPSTLRFHTEPLDEVAEQDGKPMPQDDDAGVDQLRNRLKGCLFEALEAGSLTTALVNSGMGQRPSQRCEPPSVPRHASWPPPAPALAPATAPVALQGAHAAVAATPRVLLAVSQRDRRIGELIAEIASAERSIAQRDECLREMERQLGALKLHAAHFDLDIEWHRRALLGAEERGAELEGKGPTVLKIKPGPEMNASAVSARCDLSTATGASTQTRFWTPQTPRKALAPLAAYPPAPPS